jgi:hypothetical protein
MTYSFVPLRYLLSRADYANAVPTSDPYQVVPPSSDSNTTTSSAFAAVERTGATAPDHFTPDGHVIVLLPVLSCLRYTANEHALPALAPEKVRVTLPVSVREKTLPFVRFNVTAPVADEFVATVSCPPRVALAIFGTVGESAVPPRSPASFTMPLADAVAAPTGGVNDIAVCSLRYVIPDTTEYHHSESLGLPIAESR